MSSWPGSTAQAEQYAALRHPALARVTVGADGDLIGEAWGESLPSLAESTVPPIEGLRVIGEIALGLAALHALDLAHGAVNDQTIRSAGDRWVLTGVAAPADAVTQQRDISQLAATLRPRLADLNSVAAVAGLLSDMDPASRPAADIGRSALALAEQPAPVAPISAAPTAPSALGDDPDLTRARRRTRNRMIVVGALVVIAGAVALRAIDRHGTVSVPDVEGKTRAVAVSEIQRAGLVAQISVAPSAKAAPATVTSQSPSPGEGVRPGRIVMIVVAGAQPIASGQ